MKRRQADGRKASTGPWRSLVSRTSTRAPDPATSTQSPLLPLWLEVRQVTPTSTHAPLPPL